MMDLNGIQSLMKQIRNSVEAALQLDESDKLEESCRKYIDTMKLIATILTLPLDRYSKDDEERIITIQNKVRSIKERILNRLDELMPPLPSAPPIVTHEELTNMHNPEIIFELDVNVKLYSINSNCCVLKHNDKLNVIRYGNLTSSGDGSSLVKDSFVLVISSWKCLLIPQFTHCYIYDHERIIFIQSKDHEEETYSNQFFAILLPRELSNSWKSALTEILSALTLLLPDHDSPFNKFVTDLSQNNEEL